MGMLNYLVHAMAQGEDVKTTMSDLQHIPGHHGIAEFQQDCAGVGWRFPANIQRPRVAHFSGRKPFLFDRRGLTGRPCSLLAWSTIVCHRGELGAWLAVLNEERRLLAEKVKRRLWNFVAR